MSSRFSFSRHVRDIENSNKSPHSNCSNHSTPSKATPHSTSVSPSPHTSTPTNISISTHYKPPTQLKILLPEHPNIASAARDSYPTNQIIKTKIRTRTKITTNKTDKSHLTVPSNHNSDSENYSSPLLSEPSPNPASPIPLTLNRLNRSSFSNKSTKSTKSTTSPPPPPQQEQQEQEQELEIEIEIDTAYSYPPSTTTSYPPSTTTSNYNNYSYPYLTSYPTNQSPVSTTSTYYDNLTPLYTAHILELTQSTTVPDLCLAPLDLVVSPTPIDNKLISLQIINNTPPIITHQSDYLLQANRNYNYLSDSDYDYNSDLDQNINIVHADIESENKLIAMGCCCSEANDDKTANINTTNNNGHTNNLSVPLPSKGPVIIPSVPSNSDNKASFADKYFRSNSQVKARNEKQQGNVQNNTPSVNKHIIKPSDKKETSLNHSVDDDYPPIPTPNDTPKHKYNSSNNLTLLGSLNRSQNDLNKLDDATDTRTYNTLEEQERTDIVSPIMPALDKIHSIPTKRPSTSALSSPLHSVRLSITPKGHLAPIHIMDHSDEEDNSMSTTDSKEDKEYTKYSEINTPIEFLKKHQTITKFVSKQQSQTSDNNVLSRRKRRPGVSERHTLTFSKPPIPHHELPQSPKFTEISLDVLKPRDFLHKILRGNLLFSGVDPEFSEKMVTKVVDLMRAADFINEEILMHQGAEGDAFYAVEYGKFDILVRNNETMEDNKVAIAGKGDCVGEYALLYNQPRTATLKSSERSRVWGITAEQFASMRQEIMDWNVERFEKRQQFIHSIALFQKLEQHELLNMTHACHAEIYDVDDYIIKLHEINTNVYIIMEGTVVISYDRFSSMMDNTDNNTEERAMGSGSGIGLGLNINEINNEMSSKSQQEQIELMSSNQSQLQLNLKMSSSKDEIIEIEKISHAHNLSHMSQVSHISHFSHGKYETNDTINTDGLNLQLNNMSDPPLMEDIDNNVFTINLKGGGISENTNMNNRMSDNFGVNKGIPLSLSALNSVNSMNSVHSINIIGSGGSNRNLDIGLSGACRGDRELGPSDYFAQNLFVNQYEDYDEEIVCVRCHTRCKVLKIARDDFVLIMAAQSNNESTMYLFNDTDVIKGGGELQDNKHWKNKVNNLSLTDLIEKDVLGIGSFGKVTLVENVKNGKTYALKSVSKYRVVKTGQEEHIINEKRVLTMLDSPFCVKLLNTYKTETTIYFLTEVVLGGELFTVLRYNEKFDKNATRFYAGCVILALEHLHSMDIIYRDLKPENLLLNSNGYLQLTDFGFAKRRNTTCTLCGTPQYLAPEVIHNWVQSFATDWWALGVLLYEMVVGHPPFEDDENIKMYEKILVHEPEFPGDINSKLRHLIQKLLEKNAYQRLGSGAGGARQVKLHPFFKNKLIWQDLYDQKLEPPYKPNIKSKLDTSNFDHFSDYEESDDDEFEKEIDLNSDHFKWADDF